MSNDFLDFRNAVERLVPMSNTVFSHVVSLLSVHRVAVGESLLRAGEVATHAYFVRHGLLREYYLDAAGDEATRTFCVEGDVSGSLADLLSCAPAMVCIEAVEASVLLRFEWNRFDALTHRFPEWQLVARRHAEALVLRKVTREFEMLSFSAAERHRRFVEGERDLDARLSRALVASYLGITPVHLSRIRAASTRRRPPAKRRGRS